MKRVMLFLVAVCMTIAANAKILRVSNVSGSSAPYSTIEAAHDAASAGDTIMLDISNIKYGTNTTKLTKRVVIIGAGYWLVENGIVEEGMGSSKVQLFHVEAEGVVIKGIELDALYIEAPKVVVNRCKIGTSGIGLEKGSDNCIISQNFITGPLSSRGGTAVRTNFIQITNNIFAFTGTGAANFGGFTNSYIAYNTFRTSQLYVSNTNNSTFENNLVMTIKDVNDGSNSYANNYETNIINTQATNDFIDKDYMALEISKDVMSKYGAFAGDSPYILSGVPSGPVIQDLIVPTTVEMGSKMNVTIKIGMVK